MGHPYVGFDNRLAAQSLARRVIALGHQKIGMIAGISKYNDRSADRIVGVRDAMSEAGLDRNDLILTERHYTLTAGGQALEEITKFHPDVTAVICGNDVLAAGAILTARQLGIGVPERLSITGFDDIELASAVNPALTTIHVPHRRMGQFAAQKLLALRDDPTSRIESMEMETDLIERQSLGPPRAGF